MSEEVAIVCAPTAWRTRFVPGSVEVSCGSCGARCTLSPQGQALLAAEPDAVLVCHGCFELADGWADDVRAVPGAFEAVDEILGAGAADHARQLLNRAQRRAQARRN